MQSKLRTGHMAVCCRSRIRPSPREHWGQIGWYEANSLFYGVSVTLTPLLLLVAGVANVETV